MYKTTVYLPDPAQAKEDNILIKLHCKYCGADFHGSAGRCFSFCSQCNERYEIFLKQSEDGSTTVETIVV